MTQSKEKPRRKKKKIEKEKILLVEGQDEENFFQAFIRKTKGLSDGEIQVIAVKGKDNFNETFSYLTKSDEFKKVTHCGFVRDAEENSAPSAFNSLHGIIKDKWPGVALPDKPGDIVKGPPGVGIFIMPDNKDSGMLEDLCLDYVKEKKESVYRCIAAYQECIKDNHTYKKGTFNPSKSCLMAYLASCVPICYSLGIAAQKGFFDFDAVCFKDIKNFLLELFKDK